MAQHFIRGGSVLLHIMGRGCSCHCLAAQLLPLPVPRPTGQQCKSQGKERKGKGKRQAKREKEPVLLQVLLALRHLCGFPFSCSFHCSFRASFSCFFPFHGTCTAVLLVPALAAARFWGLKNHRTLQKPPVFFPNSTLRFKKKSGPRDFHHRL